MDEEIKDLILRRPPSWAAVSKDGRLLRLRLLPSFETRARARSSG